MEAWRSYLHVILIYFFLLIIIIVYKEKGWKAIPANLCTVYIADLLLSNIN